MLIVKVLNIYLSDKNVCKCGPLYDLNDPNSPLSPASSILKKLSVDDELRSLGMKLLYRMVVWHIFISFWTTMELCGTERVCIRL